MDLKDIKTQKLGEMEKKIFFMAWLGEKLRGAGSRALPVLVGGSAVQLYTGSNYMSIDMDIYLDDIQPAADILKDHGFVKTGRQYYCEEYDLLAEFVSGSVPERVVEVEYGDMTVLVSSLEEMIVDRLNAVKWWKASKDLEWARVMISSGYGAKLDIEYLRRRAAEEDITDILEKALEENKGSSDNNIESR